MPVTPKTPTNKEKPYDRSSSPEEKPKLKPKRTPTKTKGVPWTPEENYKLFQKLHPKASVNWAEVAEYVGGGRDTKSCQNRYTIMQKQLPKLFHEKM